MNQPTTSIPLVLVGFLFSTWFLLEASVETLYNGTFKIMRTKKFVCQLFKEAVSHNSLKIVDYLTTHASDFNVTLKDLYEYPTDPEPKSSARAVRRLGIYSGMNGLTPVGSNALDVCLDVSWFYE